MTCHVKLKVFVLNFIPALGVCLLGPDPALHHDVRHLARQELEDLLGGDAAALEVRNQELESDSMSKIGLKIDLACNSLHLEISKICRFFLFRHVVTHNQNGTPRAF